jgi:glycosyltransferase involved in cell wall biosynthesis
VELHRDFEAVLAYRVGVLAPHYHQLRAWLPAAKILFHDVDLHYLREEREAELHNSAKQRARAKVRREQELGLIAKVDCTLVPTEVEKRIIEEQLPVDNVLMLPYVVPTRRSDVPFEERQDLMFLGGYRHPPNVDAVEFFASEVWPLLLDELPESARFMIVGSNPPDRVRSLASDRIIVTGHVADLGEYFDRARVFVAPLRFGAGVKGKVIQSMAYGLPTVMSSIAAEGIMLTCGEEALVADSPEAIRQSVMKLYRDRDTWLAMQSAGYAFVERNHSWQACLKGCERALGVAERTWMTRRSQQKPL